MLELQVLASTQYQLHWPAAWAPPVLHTLYVSIYELIQHAFTKDKTCIMLVLSFMVSFMLSFMVFLIVTF